MVKISSFLEVRCISAGTLEKGRDFLEKQIFNFILYFQSKEKNVKEFSLFLTNVDEKLLNQHQEEVKREGKPFPKVPLISPPLSLPTYSKTFKPVFRGTLPCLQWAEGLSICSSPRPPSCPDVGKPELFIFYITLLV